MSDTFLNLLKEGKLEEAHSVICDLAPFPFDYAFRSMCSLDNYDIIAFFLAKHPSYTGTAFLIISERNDTETIKLWTRDHSMSEEDWGYVCYFASCKGNTELIKWVFEKNPPTRVRYGETYIYRACEHSHLELLKFLFSVVSIKSPERILFWADLSNDLEILRCVLTNTRLDMSEVIRGYKYRVHSKETKQAEIYLEVFPDLVFSVDHNSLYSEIKTCVSPQTLRWFLEKFPDTVI